MLEIAIHVQQRNELSLDWRNNGNAGRALGNSKREM